MEISHLQIMALSSNSFPLYERSCGFQPSAFQPYVRTNVGPFGNNEIYQPQVISPAGDANLMSYCDTFKTFTELKSMPVQTQANVADLARLTLHEPLSLRVLPNTFFQPFPTAGPLYSHYDPTNNATGTQNSNAPDVLEQHVQRQATKAQIVLPPKQEIVKNIPQSVERDDDEDTFYVNAKQFPRIMKRREARMKLEKEGRISRTRKKYLHESRHLHALSRMRGQGGKFGKRKEALLLPPQWSNFHIPQLVQLQVAQVPVERPVLLEAIVGKQPQKEAIVRGRKRRSRVAAKKQNETS